MSLLLARPFKVGSLDNIVGECEVRVKDASTMFTIVVRKDGVISTEW